MSIASFTGTRLRALPYSPNSASLPDRIKQDIQALSDQLEAAKQGATDSPLYQLLLLFGTKISNAKHQGRAFGASAAGFVGPFSPVASFLLV